MGQCLVMLVLVVMVMATISAQVTSQGEFMTSTDLDILEVIPVIII